MTGLLPRFDLGHTMTTTMRGRALLPDPSARKIRVKGSARMRQLRADLIFSQQAIN